MRLPKKNELTVPCQRLRRSRFPDCDVHPTLRILKNLNAYLLRASKVASFIDLRYHYPHTPRLVEPLQTLNRLADLINGNTAQINYLIGVAT